jgi:hypothetical protein
MKANRFKEYVYSAALRLYRGESCRLLTISLEPRANIWGARAEEFDSTPVWSSCGDPCCSLNWRTSNKRINSMELSSSWEATSCAATPEFLNFYGNRYKSACRLRFLFYFLVCCLTVKMEAICSFWRSRPFQVTGPYNIRDRTLHINARNNLKCNIGFAVIIMYLMLLSSL